MNILSHIAYPYIFANLVAISFGTWLTPQQNILLVIFCLLPDLDYLVHWVYKQFTGEPFRPGINHHQWSSHWPISYVPLALMLIVWPNIYMVLMLFGVLSHLFLDTIACCWGVMWCYPFKKKWYNWYATRFKRFKDGVDWLGQWYQSNYFTAELIAFTITVTHFVIFG